MKQKIIGGTITSLVILALLFNLVFAFGGCRTSKEVTTTETETRSRDEIERDSLFNVILEMQASKEYEKRVQEYGGITFGDAGISHPIYIYADSTPFYIDSTYGFKPIPCPQNLLEIKPDGTINAKGNIKGYQFSKDLHEKQIETLKTKYDSLLQVKSKEVKTVETVTETKIKEVERGMGFGWSLTLAVIAFLAGMYVQKRFKPFQIFT